MDLTPINEVLGLASSAVGLTGKATSTIAAIKGLFEAGKTPDNSEASKLLNDLATELTMANMTNVQLSQALKTLSREMLRQDEFEREKARYALTQTREGDVVFKLKEDMANGQPVHFICPVCLNRDHLISFLQGNGDYRRCQTNNNHVFQFTDTPLPQSSGSDFY
ncbi:hypothetical protein [Rhizobium leguminosarum]|uniref:hypothetical protein n=1 Tax=Rhizobium leguminosarum TaxID=384 RepID=UPI001AE3542F|nr:hypothetical protein [Rhizobium leguminosarum]MBP2446379.1 hypothetical protein [Rhizobium leguminosarum]